MSMAPDGSRSGTPSPAASMEEKPSFVTPDGSSPPDTFQGETVKNPTENDVLCGRGGSINSHPGNERFRKLVEKRKRVYLTARFKREKRLIASSIVSEIRALNPPGRFLARDGKSGLWKDIGDEKARDKTSQALRENAPTIRAEIETELNEQRAEQDRAEEDDEVAARASAAQHPHSYYNPGWGYYSYYGYSHHAPPPPPPHHGHPPPPPPHGYPPPPYDGGHWGPPAYVYSHDPYAPPPPPPPPPKSALEKTADYISSGAESIKSWTKSLGGGGVGGSVHHSRSHDGHDNRSAGSTISSKPITYVHEDESKKRRIVKFQDEFTSRRKASRPVYSPVHSGNSLVEIDDIEPQKLDAATDEQGMSLMSQFANHILSSIGSWDAATIVCGHDTADEKIPFPDSHPSSSLHAEDVHRDEDMAVEWEGQEVQLVEKSGYDSEASNERMPPPVVRQRPVPDQTGSIGYSSLGSCHSWLPEQFGSAASFFSYSRGGVSPAASMEMEYSAAENFSAGGSIGGGSLTRVFEHEGMPSPSMSQRALNQIPSWERSLRSRSPLSIGTDDDGSLISKTSSKLSEGQVSPATDDGQHGSHDMQWEKE